MILAAELRALGSVLHPAIVTIDGPAASGKSTVGFALANQLDYLYFDTGIMYRAVTVAVLMRNMDPHNADAVAGVAEAAQIDLAPPLPDIIDGRQVTVLLDGVDVTWELRRPETDRAVSPVSANAGVRRELTRHQRRIGWRYAGGAAEKQGIVMVGRDIGTVVMTEAPVKIYMDATPEERARRRHAELLARGKAADYGTILADIIRRDEQDGGRALAPMRPAADALIIDTSTLTPPQVVEQILAEIRRIGAGLRAGG
jgi:cytidylate kinase